MQIVRSVAARSAKTVPAVTLVLCSSVALGEPVPLDCLSGLTDYTDVGRIIYAIDARGDHLAVQGLVPTGFGVTIRLWDISDPASPALISEPATAFGLFEPTVVSVSYPLVVSAQGNHSPGPNSLRVFDFSDMNAPVQAATLGSSVQAAKLIDQTLYMIDDAALKIYDLTDPAAPVPLGTAPLPGVSAADMTVGPGFVYIAGDAARIVDVSDPTAPAQVGIYTTVPMLGVAYADGFLYATTAQSLLILDLANPANPTLRSQTSVPFSRDIEVVDSVAYIGQWWSRGVARIDVTNPDSPLPLDPLNSPAFLGSIPLARSGDALFAGGSTGFSRIQTNPVQADATSLAEQFGPGTLPSNARIPNAKFADGIGYLCDSINNTLYVVQADAAVPSVIGSLPLSFNPRAIELAGGFAFIAGSGTDLHRIDISDPTSPVTAGTLPLPVSSIAKMSQRDGRLFLMSAGSDFAIVDLANPSVPAVLGSGSTTVDFELLDIDGNGDILVVTEASQQAGAVFHYLTVFDISNPAAPVQAGRRLLDGAARNVALRGTVAWVVQSDIFFKSYFPGTLVGYDISGPGQPQVLGQITFSSSRHGDDVTSEFSGLSVDATRAIVSHRSTETGLAVFDIAAPAEPRLLGSSPGRFADWITHDGDRVYAGHSLTNRVDVFLDGACQGGPGCSPADLAEPYGVLNFFDLAAYLDLFNAGDPAADLAPPFGVLNFFDLAAYLDLYNAGCP